ncbi:hypothetical protein QQM39_26175 [Streptomyces sp. DT2A-34]|uniref:hypothetical protein n=1 Tax=Streptomyces sp. DT2A-34 TaxID=3051182 RepID=UPI00265C2846|nr:hypothetical protein [Streptomyces sp. DT2A-34]MDO0913012.1 hypothetical protein [Streptomyces sp. DT2A-34]MDO0914189.1 hypothetical protein [Streptomyces sp. DT2A-34]
MTDPVPSTIPADDIARALSAVLVPAPGKWLQIPAVHSAVLAHLGVRNGASYKDIKNVLRGAGVLVANYGPEHCARDVALASGVTVRDLEKKLRNLRRRSAK